MYDTRTGEAGWTESGFESPFNEAVVGPGAGATPEPRESLEESGEVEDSEVFEALGSEWRGQAGAAFEGPAFEGEGFPSGLVLPSGTGATGERAEHWDPHNTGLPLLATGPAVRSQRLSDHFTVGELVRSGGRFADVARISPALVRLLEAMRVRSGKAVTITSGYRSWARNKQVYAGYGKTATLSRHCSGQAADVRIAGMSGLEIAKLALDVGGRNLGVGIGGTYAHVDVRGSWAYWTYLSGDAGRRAKEAIAAYRAQLRPATGQIPPVAPVPLPQPVVPAGSTDTTGAGQLVVREHPLLAGHAGTHPDLMLGWNGMSRPAAIDVVVHLHGFSPSGRAMDLAREKAPASGLDLAGRSRPTLTVLPRGNFYGGDSGRGYSFPALVKPGALARLCADALARFTAQTGVSAPAGRLILTAHSGGGAPLTAILAHTDPDEVYIFDGLYNSGAAVSTWALGRLTRELAQPSAVPPALRVFYRAGTAKRPGTQRNSEAVGGSLCAPLGAASVPDRLRARFRVELTTTKHDDIPGAYGGLLLGDAGADVPGTTRFRCGGSPARETEVGGEWLEASAEQTGESEAWLEPEGYEAEGYVTEGEGYDSEADEAQGYEAQGYEAQGYEAQGYETPGYQPEGYETPGYQAEGFETPGYQAEGYETPGYQAEGYETQEYETEGYETEGNETEGNENDELAGYEFEDKPVKTVCGFFAPTVPVVSETTIRQKVVAAARAEQALWTSSASALLPESGSSTFGHLIRYWLSEQSGIPAANLVVIAARTPNTTYGATLLGAATIAPAAVNAAARRIARLLIRSLPLPGTPANLENLVVEAILAARRSKLDAIAWSAAFINSCVRRAGMQLNLQGLTGGGEETLLKLSPLGRHWEYLLEAHRRRFGCQTSPTTFDASCRRNGTYHAFRTTEHVPQTGDIIVQDRNANSAAALLTFDHIPGLTGLEMHADIVVDVQPTFVETIGGNVGNTVRRRRYPVDATGFLVVSQLQRFVGQNTNGSFPAMPAAAAAPPPAVLPGESTARIVAVLRPVQQCRTVLA
ncbi:DUF2272 domain-containing protein [Glaciibacter sp. 2TAF33]|uniref:DUF2272 domain-containing protein n=1 Tax=Glaciibacter sp. 2TAF33 TaxID=3233015 RepID=UPI003F93E24A